MYKANHLKVVFNLVTQTQKRTVIFIWNVKRDVRITLQTLTLLCDTTTPLLKTNSIETKASINLYHGRDQMAQLPWPARRLRASQSLEHMLAAHLAVVPACRGEITSGAAVPCSFKYIDTRKHILNNYPLSNNLGQLWKYTSPISMSCMLGSYRKMLDSLSSPKRAQIRQIINHIKSHLK